MFFPLIFDSSKDQLSPSAVQIAVRALLNDCADKALAAAAFVELYLGPTGCARHFVAHRDIPVDAKLVFLVEGRAAEYVANVLTKNVCLCQHFLSVFFSSLLKHGGRLKFSVIEDAVLKKFEALKRGDVSAGKFSHAEGLLLLFVCSLFF